MTKVVEVKPETAWRHAVVMECKALGMETGPRPEALEEFARDWRTTMVVDAALALCYRAQVGQMCSRKRQGRSVSRPN